MQRLLACAAEVEELTGRPLAVVSGGASNVLSMIAEGRMPSGITNVRVGEAILLGRETIHRSALAGTFQDAFVLAAEVLEVQRKWKDFKVEGIWMFIVRNNNDRSVIQVDMKITWSQPDKKWDRTRSFLIVAPK